MMVSYNQPAVLLFYKEDNNAESVLPAESSGQERRGPGQWSADIVRGEKLQAMGGECGTSVGEGGRGIMVETHRRLMKTTEAI